MRVHAMRTAGRSVLVAGTTVVIGMMGLLVLRESLMKGVAVTAAATVAMVVLGSLTLLPALLGFTGTRLAKPSRFRLPRRRGRRPVSADTPVRSEVVVFLSFVLGADVSVKQVGLGLAVAVLIDATVVRLVLVPAVMELLGRANWWLPRPLARILPAGPVAENVPEAPAPVSVAAGDPVSR